MIRMPSRWARALALVSTLVFGSDAIGQVLSQRQCQTTWQGQLIQGVVQVEWLPYSQTHRIYGEFRDPPGNLIEFEVITNQPGGVGGMWFNNARHREIHIELAFLNERTFDIRGDAGTARYFCR